MGLLVTNEETTLQAHSIHTLAYLQALPEVTHRLLLIDNIFFSPSTDASTAGSTTDSP
jgi:hypothetical protein